METRLKETRTDDKAVVYGQRLGNVWRRLENNPPRFLEFFPWLLSLVFINLFPHIIISRWGWLHFRYQQ